VSQVHCPCILSFLFRHITATCFLHLSFYDNFTLRYPFGFLFTSTASQRCKERVAVPLSPSKRRQPSATELLPRGPRRPRACRRLLESLVQKPACAKHLGPYRRRRSTSLSPSTLPCRRPSASFLLLHSALLPLPPPLRLLLLAVVLQRRRRVWRVVLLLLSLVRVPRLLLVVVVVLLLLLLLPPLPPSPLPSSSSSFLAPLSHSLPLPLLPPLRAPCFLPPPSSSP